MEPSKSDLEKYIKAETYLSVKVDQVTNEAIVFEFQGSVTYKLLDELSKLFGTDDIDVGSEQRSSGGCSTCEFSWTVITITIGNYKLNQEKFSKIQ